MVLVLVPLSIVICRTEASDGSIQRDDGRDNHPGEV